MSDAMFVEVMVVEDFSDFLLMVREKLRIRSWEDFAEVKGIPIATIGRIRAGGYTGKGTRTESRDKFAEALGFPGWWKLVEAWNPEAARMGMKVDSLSVFIPTEEDRWQRLEGAARALGFTPAEVTVHFAKLAAEVERMPRFSPSDTGPAATGGRPEEPPMPPRKPKRPR